MAGFIRRGTSFPPVPTITSIEGVYVVDTTGPAMITGVGTGVVAALGEFQKGTLYYNIPTEVTGEQDFAGKYGGFDTYLGEQHAIGGISTQKTWDGNGWLPLQNKGFSRLVVVKVNDSIGDVTFTRTLNTYAYTPEPLDSNLAPFTLTAAGTLNFQLDGGGGLLNQTATFYADPAVTQNGVNELWNLTAPANVLTLKVGTGSTQTLTMAAGYFVNPAVATAKEVAAAINALATGIHAFTSTTAGIYDAAGKRVSIVTDKIGADASVQVTGGTANALLQYVTTTAVPGTKSWRTMKNMRRGQWDTVVEAVTGGTAGSLISITLVGDSGAGVVINRTGTDFVIHYQTGVSTVANVEAAIFALAGADKLIETKAAGTGGNILATATDDFAAVYLVNVADISAATMAESIAIINASLTTRGLCWSDDAVHIKARTTTAGSGGKIQVMGTSSLYGAFGFDTTLHTGTATGVGVAGTIPAGTRISDGGVNIFGTCEDVTFGTTTTTGIGAESGSASIHVRPASAPASAGVVIAPGAINTVVGGGVDIDGSGVLSVFTVTNAAGLINFKTGTRAGSSYTGIEGWYQEALAALDSEEVPSREVNIVLSARHSATIGLAIKNHCVLVSNKGVGRECTISPPLGSVKSSSGAYKTSTFVAASGETGYGALYPSAQSDRHFYCYPGGQTTVSAVGTTPIDVTSDSWLASVCSQINPEENPGQATDYMSLMTALESNVSSAPGALIGPLSMTDYQNFRTYGIVAPRIDQTAGPIFQSGITTSTDATRKNISRRRMADFIQDSVAARAKYYVKKIYRGTNTATFTGEVYDFLSQLVSADQPKNQRIDSFELDDEKGNTTTMRDMGIFVLVVKVRLLGSMDFIVLDTSIGETVVINQVA